jgi:hypothetical protein
MAMKGRNLIVLGEVARVEGERQMPVKNECRHITSAHRDRFKIDATNDMFKIVAYF